MRIIIALSSVVWGVPSTYNMIWGSDITKFENSDELASLLCYHVKIVIVINTVNDGVLY